MGEFESFELALLRSLGGGEWEDEEEETEEAPEEMLDIGKAESFYSVDAMLLKMLEEDFDKKCKAENDEEEDKDKEEELSGLNLDFLF